MPRRVIAWLPIAALFNPILVMTWFQDFFTRTLVAACPHYIDVALLLRLDTFSAWYTYRSFPPPTRALLATLFMLVALAATGYYLRTRSFISFDSAALVPLTSVILYTVLVGFRRIVAANSKAKTVTPNNLYGVPRRSK